MIVFHFAKRHVTRADCNSSYPTNAGNIPPNNIQDKNTTFR